MIFFVIYYKYDKISFILFKNFQKFGQDNEFFNELCYGYNFWHNFVSQLNIW